MGYAFVQINGHYRVALEWPMRVLYTHTVNYLHNPL